MKPIQTLDQLKRAYYWLSELQKIERKLHRIDEANCNRGENQRRKTAEARLMREAEELATNLGLFAFHQSDPRGRALYLTEVVGNFGNYPDGLCL